VQDSVFIGNKAVGGGAVAAGSPYISGPTFIGSTAEQGGALALNAGVEPPALSDIVVRDNTASGDGGGIYTFSLNISGSQVTGNHSGGDGGGLLNAGFDYVLVRDTSFQGNSARNGGGLYNGGSFGNLALTGSTVSGNHASADGGGVYNQSDVDADHTRIVRNTAATAGGGIYDDVSPATATLTNSLVLANSPGNCDPPGSITDCTG
jgi:predicted outer membrane repeat protein